jgi:hypothetical protein
LLEIEKIEFQGQHQFVFFLKLSQNMMIKYYRRYLLSKFEKKLFMRLESCRGDSARAKSMDLSKEFTRVEPMEKSMEPENPWIFIRDPWNRTINRLNQNTIIAVVFIAIIGQ